MCVRRTQGLAKVRLAIPVEREIFYSDSNILLQYVKAESRQELSSGDLLLHDDLWKSLALSLVPK